MASVSSRKRNSKIRPVTDLSKYELERKGQKEEEDKIIRRAEKERKEREDKKGRERRKKRKRRKTEERKRRRGRLWKKREGSRGSIDVSYYLPPAFPVPTAGTAMSGFTRDA